MILKRIITFNVLLYLLCCNPILAQEENSLLSVSLKNQRLDSLISCLSKLSGYEFSYNPLIIPADTIISVEYENKSLKDILEDFRKYGISYTKMEEHIILKKTEEAAFPGKESIKKNKYTVSGYIWDSETGEALIGATIVDKQTGAGAMTNGYGFFSLTLDEGEYELISSFLGYKRSEDSLVLDKDKYMVINLEQSVASLEEIVVVSGKDNISSRQAGTGEFSLKSSDISGIQGFLGQSDVIKSLQTMPGINFYGDGSTIFYVRGGAGDQNMILIDEAPVYNPAHMLGLFSVFTVESLNSIKVYKGDMPASLGGRISSVIDVKLKEGNSNKLSFHGNTSPVLTSLNLEGPLFNKKSTFYLSARRSHFKWLLGNQNENIELLHFFDFNLKTNFRLNTKNRLFLSLYSGSDNFKNRTNNLRSNGITWKNLAGNLRWNHVFGDRLFSNTSIIISNYDYNLYTSYEENQRWNTGISIASLKSDFSFYLSPGHTYRAGFALSLHSYSPGNYYSGSNPDPLARGVPAKNALENVLYFDFENEIFTGVVLNYGIRWSIWNNLGPTTEYIYDDAYQPVDTLVYTSHRKYNTYSVIEPRINLNYSINHNLSASLSFSHNAQFEHLISNSISPFTSLEAWLPAAPNIKPSTSDQVSAGISFHTGENKYSFDLEYYNKVMHNYISYVDHAYMLFNPHVEGELRYGKGKSYGIECLARKNAGNLTGWISYTWSRTILDINDLNDDKPFPSRYDRPHNLNVHIDLRILPVWLLSTNWIYCSGSPITTPTGFYYYKGYQVPFYDSRNNDRLPDYHRLDLSTEIRLNRQGSSFEHSLKIALYNAYGRKNPFTINFNKIIEDSGALIVPTERSEPPELNASMMYVHGVVPSISYQFKF